METIAIKLRVYISVFALIVVGSLPVWGESIMDGKDKKEIHKTFSVSMSDKLSVDNRFGDVTITHWNKKEISIRVVIEASARTDKRTEELMSYVKIDIDKSSNIVSAKTSMKNFGGTRNNERLRIDYFISMPATLQSNIELKYGNLYMPEKIEGVTALNVKYGNIKAGSFTTSLTIESKYGDVHIGNVKNANLDLGYCGGARVGDGESITVDSRYSNTTYGEVERLVIDDKYGNVSIKSVEKATVYMAYGNLNIGIVKSSLISELKYSNLDLKQLEANFSKLDIEAGYGNATIRIPSDAAFNVEASNMKYADYSISGFNTKNRKNDSDGVSHYSEVNNGNSRRVIKFKGNKYSNLNIRAIK